MKNIVSILILGLFWISAFAENDDIAKETQNLILKTFTYSDQNPIYHPESEFIVEEFQKILANRTEHDKTSQFTQDIENLFKYLFKNSLWEYEDSSENRRMKMRRAFCFASLALLSEDNKSLTFIEYAKLSIIEHTDNPDFYLLEEQLLGINILEMLVKHEKGLVNNSDILSIENFLKDNQDEIEKSIINEASILMEKYRGNLK
ncbi:hypothetical protein [Marinifilum sp. D737]|uniref:hypothetical protein n=1 Tax=Marinifilum sp. D737 TaxID=2969628 RepID=UPI002276A952|nr:hypothetical protein [Marinifilum sp. D737]MCY1633518.1 hypothetical protein [Marinifilum sp. D737]